MIRGTKKRYNTQKSVCDSIRALEHWSEDRFGHPFTHVIRWHTKIDNPALIDLCIFLRTRAKHRRSPKKVVEFRSKEKVRRAPLNHEREENSRATVEKHLRAQAKYCAWLMVEFNHNQASTIKDLFHTQIGGIEHTPTEPREGFSATSRNELMKVIDPASLDNPFKDPAVRLRNYILLRLLYDTGVRIGELLAAFVDDFDPARKRFTILPRPQQPLDTRTHPPSAKTQGRDYPVKPDLLPYISQYIQLREAIPEATRQPFLFVSHRQNRGAPLSYKGASRIIDTLKPFVSENLFFHRFRHDFNDRLSEEFDAKKVPEEQEKRVRNQMNGWKRGSDQAGNYTVRHTKKKAWEFAQAVNERDAKHGGFDDIDFEDCIPDFDLTADNM